MTKVSEVDVISGKEEIDRMCEHDEERRPRNWVERFWFWLV